MKVVAFDLGSNMAAAINTLPGEIAVRSRQFQGRREHRFQATWDWLNEVLEANQDADAVIYERPFARGRDATRCLWGLAGLIETAATVHGLPVVDIDPQTIKKWTCGFGGAKKADMILIAQSAGYQGDNEHEADAYNLNRYGQEVIRKHDPKTIR